MSENLQIQVGKKLPWIFGRKMRIPKVNYPMYQDSKMNLPTPGRSFTLLVIYLALFWLMMGGIYISIRNPIPLGSSGQNKVLWLYPSTSEAFIIESVVAATLMFIGGTGFLILYNSTKHAYNYSYSIKLLIIAITAIALSFGMLQYMLAVKAGTISQ